MLFQNSKRNPRLAIVGRPNVGKSTFFNLVTETRKAVVKNRPGVTRDIQSEMAEWVGKEFEVLDTGGITDAQDTFSKLIKEQVTEILSAVDCAVMVVDGRAGLCPEDRDMVRLLKEHNIPFSILVNKIDHPRDDALASAEFYEFGVEVFPCSFEQRFGVPEVLDWVLANLPEQSMEVREGLTIAIVGKPNAGKSSLCNQLLGENRMLVSEIAGTTVDSIDSELIYNDKKYILIDTAGLRRPAKRRDDVEILSAFKSRDSIRRAQLVLLMIDIVEGPSDQDARMLEDILRQHKAVIVVANKCDIAESEMDAYRSSFRAKIEHVFHFFVDVPVCFISAKTKLGIKKLFEEIESINEKMATRISTKKLNDFFFDVIRKAPAPVYGAYNVKFYYLTQTKQTPPSFIAFANYPDGVHNAYRRFLKKRLAEEFGLEGIPLRIFVMQRAKRKKTREEEIYETSNPSFHNEDYETPDYVYMDDGDFDEDIDIDESALEELNDDVFLFDPDTKPETQTELY